MPIPGHDEYIIDDFTGGDTSGDTDRLFLLDPNGPMTPTVATRADTEDDTLNARIRAFFEDGGKTVYLQGYDAISGGLPPLATAVGQLPSGAGQVVVPDLVASADHISVIPLVSDQNKCYLAQGPGNASDSALVTLAGVIRDGVDARFAALFADTIVHRGIAPDSTVNVPSTITVAALIAASDRLTGNPNLAAAGKRGITRAIGVTDLRSDTRRSTLATGQVNSFKLVGSTLRNYGFRSLADTDALPQWKQFTGARLIMAWRQLVAGVNEEFNFEQIDGKRIMLDNYQTALQAAAKTLYDKGALYGDTPEEAYNVDTTEVVNPTEDIQAGLVQAHTRLKVSPFAEHIVTTIVRRELTAAL